MPETMESEPTQEVVQKTREAATIVIDHYLDNEENSFTAAIPQLVRSEEFNISLVHATAEDSNTKLYSEFREKLHPANTTHARQVADKLGSLGFEIKQIEQCGMSDSCAREILTSKSADDLLVIVSNYLQIGPFMRSQFTTRLAEYAPCSVLLLTNRIVGATETLKVLFATDGSEASLKAARRLPELLKTGNMAVTVATVQNYSYIDNPMMAPFVNVPYMEKALDENSKLILDTAKATLEALGVNVVETRKLSGAPGYQLLALAEKEKPDLIVVGSHNLKGLPAWFLGSVSTQLLHKHASNLLIVR